MKKKIYIYTKTLSIQNLISEDCKYNPEKGRGWGWENRRNKRWMERRKNERTYKAIERKKGRHRVRKNNRNTRRNPAESVLKDAAVDGHNKCFRTQSACSPLRWQRPGVGHSHWCPDTVIMSAGSRQPYGKYQPCGLPVWPHSDACAM